MTTAPLERDARGQDRFGQMARSVFSAVGILPLLMVAVIIIFASQEARFYGTANITNVLRQSTFLIIVTLGQALVLISGGFDLSVGAVIAVTSVITARYMSNFYAANPENELMALIVGVAAGLVVGLVFGLVSGIGVARFKVSPFIMTLGMASVGSGFALYYTGGSPVSGMPPLFTKEIGTGRWFDILRLRLLRGRRHHPRRLSRDVDVLGPLCLRHWRQYQGCFPFRHPGRALHGVGLRPLQPARGTGGHLAHSARLVRRAEPGSELPIAVDHRRRRRRRFPARW